MVHAAPIPSKIRPSVSHAFPPIISHPSLRSDEADDRYVYHVHKHDYTGFVAALKAATSNEIPSFIPEYMTEMAVRERVKYLMEHDWKEDARKLLEERKQEGKGYIFEL